MPSKDDILTIIFCGVEMEKSEIRKRLSLLIVWIVLLYYLGKLN